MSQRMGEVAGGSIREHSPSTASEAGRTRSRLAQMVYTAIDVVDVRSVMGMRVRRVQVSVRRDILG
jgi:hypothetical protein